MEFTILGPFEARTQDRVLPLGGPKQRAVLAQLLLNAGDVVSRDRLVAGTWSEPPESADKAVQVHVSQLRKALGTDAPIRTHAQGYVLDVPAEQLDLSRFERLVAEARAARDRGEDLAAAAAFREALALWRGPPLAEFAQEPFATTEAARLAELRLAALEDRIDADLALGRHGELVAELEAIVAAEPLRERLRGQLMLALYRSGRQAAALETYRDARRMLDEELGLEPGLALQRLERGILVHDPELELELEFEREPPSPAVAPPAAPAEPLLARAPEQALEVRKTVTIVFCDVTGSTSLGETRDPELMRRVLARYFDEMRVPLEHHGGTVEKFIGDAVMAVFGTPVMHEDDALRALRAAGDMRDRLAVLNEELERAYGVRLEIRIGVSSGEVVAGDPTRRETFVTGDAVIVAQRLQVQAQPGEILLGARTYRLARESIEAEPLEPLQLKGKAEPVTAYRLLRVAEGAQPRRQASPMVGRGRERLLLQDAFGRAVQQRACHLFTVLGPAGVGKSRLVAEALAAIGERARVLTGSCLPYGEGITFRPVAEIVAQAIGDADLRAGVEQLVEGAEAGLIAEHVAALAGREGPAGSADESFWAVRRLLEALARERPLVVVFDDVNWGEPTFLDFIEHVAEWTRDAPLLLVCMARPELHDLRPSWGGGKHNATSIFLEPLTEVETDRLIRNLLGSGALDAALLRRIRRAAGGNPLFVEELVALLLEEGLLQIEGGQWQAAGGLHELPVPASIQVLLASRLDLLGREERQVLERAAVEGQRFHRSAVEHLSDQSPAHVGGSLQALVRKELVRQTGDDEFLFRHLLIRDAAYDSMPKQVRGVLHERFAEWASASGDEPELDEILGHHLEQAHAYRVALGPAGPAEEALAARAAERLAVAGRRALTRNDANVAAKLLSRAAALRVGDPELLVDLGEALFASGDFTEAERVNAEARAAAAAAGDARSEVAARLSSAMIGLLVRAEAGVDEIAADVHRALPTFERAGDDATVARLLIRLGAAYWWRCQVGPFEETLERALYHARRAGDERQVEEIASRLGFAAVVGPLPVDQARGRLDELLAETAGGSTAHGLLLVCSGLVAAMAGDFEEARRRSRAGRDLLDSLDGQVAAALITTYASGVELLAGDGVAAERELRPATVRLEELGALGNLASVTAQLAEALELQGRHEEALEAARTSEQAASPDDVHAQIAWRVARAKALASVGRAEEAERDAREAVELAGGTDSPLFAADALLSLAAAHAARGAPAEAAAAAEQALRLYEAKGNVVAALGVRTFTASRSEARTP